MQDVTYSNYVKVGQAGWPKEKACQFNFDIQDTTAVYEVIVHVRNTGLYPYRNLWLFINGSNGDSFLNDTLEIMLADEYGRWTGKGLTLYESSNTIFSDCLFPRSGGYAIEIRQGMRNDNLAGIQDIGLEINKKRR
jgi:gliding motility-associated lipoprotein GldH